ncbi:GCN5-related N-acetyltransferase [Haladaptatus paucihalophilus DX253]|uniref:GCN5-related N-acetyltransferase n=1 Tax=Haladaptatus paucihalophilus DX253 TaxID=797209 RepID=E7R017_HALPU|nr:MULTISPECIES: GNAT family N-acetyltransferase [Haladaptatus]EFW89911.1 GCN5-related N-acetyltransferase [Haladaptatus paucihalophilus DX253]GKZ12927.1 N-acetyltransferase [Haladaptatus sp. T7]SHK57924.1 L-amino acid N-acyltransferase YncA [Haladaptatus paucihalophilus DX253]
MGAPADLEFEDTIQQRIYHHVERSGSATVEEVRDEVRIDSRSGSKPARSGTTEPRVRIPPEEFHETVADLVDAGLLVRDEGELHLALDEEVETYEEEDLSYRIRQARQSDWSGIETAIREVADEGASISAQRVAADISDEGALLRRNDRRSRMFYVATVEGGENDGEVAGWVHLDAPELDQLRHTAELTVGVRGPFREHGIGGRLLERAMDWARDAGYTKVYQSLPATNETAIELLQEYGWETEATRADHYLVGDEFVDEVMMARKL